MSAVKKSMQENDVTEAHIVWIAVNNSFSRCDRQAAFRKCPGRIPAWMGVGN
jgi:hypothetical protein